MKIRLPALELKHALTGGLFKVIPRRSTLPVLQTVHIEAAEDRVRITATDLDAFVTYTCKSATVLETGTAAVEARRVKDLVANATKDEVLVESIDSTTIRVTLDGPLGTRDQAVPAFDVKEWPALPKTIPTEPADPHFLETFRKLVPFTSKDESREILTGVCVDVREGKYTLVATDGRRLTCYNSLSLPVAETCVIPAHKLLSWSKLGDACRLGVSENGLFRLETGPWAFQGKLVEGAYPNFRQVIPEQNGSTAFVLAEEDLPVLQDALRTLPKADGDTQTVVLTHQAESLVLAAQDGESQNWSRRVIPVSTWSGKPVPIAVNRRFFHDAVNAGFRRFAVTDENSPLRAEDGNGGLHVLMPMRCSLPKPETRSPKRKEPRNVIKANDKKPSEAGEDQLWLGFQAVKEGARELNTAIAELGNQIKAAKKQDKTVRTELDNARGVLAKLQSISL